MFLFCYCCCRYSFYGWFAVDVDVIFVNCIVKVVVVSLVVVSKAIVVDLVVFVDTDVVVSVSCP